MTVKIFCTLLSSFLFLIVFSTAVNAANVALVVKDASSLSDFHEKRLKTFLEELNHTVILVDKNSNVNYTSIDLIVVAGRPGNVAPGEHLDAFVANLPVNNVPTLAIDSFYPVYWGWVESGVSTVSSNQIPRIYVQGNHSIVDRYPIGTRVNVHTVLGFTILDIFTQRTNLSSIASVDSLNRYGVIFYAGPGTELSGNKKVSDGSAIVFFGISYPIYWTDDAILLFKKAVNWLLDFSSLKLQIVSPASGSVYRLNDTVFVDVLVNSPTLEDGADCKISLMENHIINLKFNKTSGRCSGNIALQNIGNISGQTYLKASATTLRGVTNSTSQIIFLNRTFMLTVKTDKSVYVAGENVKVSGKFSFADSGLAISDAAVTYKVTQNVSGTVKTNSSGDYLFTIANLLAGSYELVVEANYSTEHVRNISNFNISGGSTYVASVGGNNASTFFANFVMRVFENVYGTSGKNVTFYTIIENVGNTDLQNLSVSVENVSGKVRVIPSAVNLPAKTLQAFEVQVDLQNVSAGTYKILIIGSTATHSISKEINLVVNKVLQHKINITEISTPTNFSSGEKTQVKVVIENLGDFEELVTVRISLPSGWEKVVPETKILLPAGKKQEVPFTITAGETSGIISFVASTASGQNSTASKNAFVASVVAEAGEEPLSMSAQITAVVSNPLFLLFVAGVVTAFVTAVQRLRRSEKEKEELVQKIPKKIKRQKKLLKNRWLEKWEKEHGIGA